MDRVFKDAAPEKINLALQQSWKAFLKYRKYSLKQRADFMRTIAGELDALGEGVIRTAMEETHLPEERLKGERTRTIFQLRSYAAAAEAGEWLEARIDTAIPDRRPAPRPDLRKMLVPLGPVAVFGASNFPFAYSTAGGDTACAFAAGCPVIVKAHPAHAGTSEIVAGAILKAAEKCGMPEGIFAHIHGAAFDVGKALVMHPLTKAVGFTGSFAGGKALYDAAAQRKVPIPVFAEMGSINPVFLLPDKLRKEVQQTAKLYAGSITQGVGQFCTNPGLIIGVEGEGLQQFIRFLATEIRNIAPATMLHPGIARSFVQKREEALKQPGVITEAVSEVEARENQGLPTIASASGQAFLNNPVLHREVFGPYSIVISCRDIEEMIRVAQHLEGQLTSTIMCTDEDAKNHPGLFDAVQDICGRFILNGVPTGVEVCRSMQHGGPFPATTDSRFTSVGADGIRRFARPVCYQNWPGHLLPPELQDANPLNLWRMVNDNLTNQPIGSVNSQPITQ